MKIKGLNIPRKIRRKNGYGAEGKTKMMKSLNKSHNEQYEEFINKSSSECLTNKL